MTYLDVQADGLVNLDAFKAAIRPDTILASVMFVNNEIGVIQDIAAIGTICREKGVIFHVDAAQATGRVDIDLQTLAGRSDEPDQPQDLWSQGHRRTVCAPQAAHPHRGADARWRSRARHAIGYAARPTSVWAWARPTVSPKKRCTPKTVRIRALHDRMVAGLKDIEEVFINGHETRRVPHNLNMSFNYVEGESLIMGIKGLAVSSGSACTSASLEPSYVLRALGRSDELAHSSLRMTIGRWTTEAGDRFRDRRPSRKTSPSSANSPRCGRCSRTASICPPSSGQRTGRRTTMAYSEKVVDHYENPPQRRFL